MKTQTPPPKSPQQTKSKTTPMRWLVGLFFPTGFSYSMPMRAWMAVAAIALLVVTTTTISALLAQIAESDAEAINTAGSIRMASWRINYVLSTDYPWDKSDGILAFDKLAFDDTLRHDGSHQTITSQLVDDMQHKLDYLHHYQQKQGNRNSLLDSKLTMIERTWQQTLKPRILAHDTEGVYIASLGYINAVDDLVAAIQKRNETRQSYQQIIQFSAMFLTLVIMLAGMYELNQNALLPLGKLTRAVKRFQAGRLDKDNQVILSGYKEINALGLAFNEMTATIYNYQNHLHDEVATKTAHLTQANQALFLLYDFAHKLASEPVSMPKLQSLIQRFADTLPNTHIALCLHSDEIAGKDLVSLHSTHQQSICSQTHCDHCSTKNNPDTKIYPISSNDTEWGQLLVTHLHPLIKTATPNDSRRIATVMVADNFFHQDELLKTLANLIGVVFFAQKQREQEHLLILFEERNTIARELHDSLAQSLSYLNIQLSMLDKLIEQNRTAADEQKDELAHKIDAIRHQIKTGLGSAYSQLRSILVTFRLQIAQDGFDVALQEACDEFATKGGFKVTMNNTVMTVNLTATEQIDLLQIAREALSNVNRHAKATSVKVELTQDDSQIVSLSISDDGIGLNLPDDDRQHHGLKIMKERSNNLAGTFCIQPNTPSGTQVVISFLPLLFNSQKPQKNQPPITELLKDESQL